MKGKVLLLCAVIALMGSIDTAHARGKYFPYVVKIRPYPGESGHYLIQLKRKSNSHIIWSYKCYEYEPQVIWSKDHRAVVVESVTDYFVWREGYRLRDFAVPRWEDYTMGCAWSPDKRHLLIRCGHSGDSDTDVGEVFCLELRKGNEYKYLYVGRSGPEMGWRNNQIVYWGHHRQTVNIHDLEGRSTQPPGPAI